MRRKICALLALCLLLSGLPALALTGEEALGLTGGGQGNASTYPTLHYGSKDGDDAGAYVVMLQNRLLELGYLHGAADGAFGEATESALIKFQETNELTATGIADNMTQSVLYSNTAKQATVEGVDDNEIYQVQQALIRWGFMTGFADGLDGEATQMGVAEFKNYIASNARYASYATPTPGPIATLAPGEQAVALDIPLEPEISVNGHNGTITDEVRLFVNGTFPFQVYQTTLREKSEGAEVWRVQRRLQQLGYLFKPDGGFGSLTTLALKYFQYKNGLKQSGVADQATQNKLFSADALSAEEYVFPYKIGVNTKKQRVFIYGWDGTGYNKKVGSCKCSTGQRGYETPKGTYQSGGKCTSGTWYYFKQYGSYAKYATRIVGGVLFHSVLYSKKGGYPTGSSVRNLGKAVSHGCVRLPEANAKWIFENCPEGTTVVVY